MIWPFSKRQPEAEKFLALMPRLVEVVSDKWLYFSNTLVFKEDIPLKDKIAAFSVPTMEGMSENVKGLKSSPDAALFLVIALGILKSGTHTKEEIEAALGAKLPDLN